MHEKTEKIPANILEEARIFFLRASSKKYCRITDVADAPYRNLPLIRFIRIVGKERPLHVAPNRSTKSKTKDFNIGIRTIARLANAQATYKVTKSYISTSEIRCLLKRYYNLPLQQCCLAASYNSRCILEAIYILINKYRVLQGKDEVWLHQNPPQDGLLELFMRKQFRALEVAENRTQNANDLLASLSDFKRKHPRRDFL